MNKYRRCNRCIMDNKSDDTISFDDNGFCNYCTNALLQIGTTTYFPNEEGEKRLADLLNKLRVEGKGKQYDAIMGISGGLDSSYLAYLGYKWGLRIMLVHIDDGFDTEISKKNLQKLVEKTGFDYKVIKPDKEQYRALIKAYMKAAVPNVAVPQDNILLAFIHDYMKKNRIRYFLSGGNFALECILQHGNTHKASDVVNLKSINHKCGTGSLDKLKFISTIQIKIDELILRIKSPRPLNLINYNRDCAFQELSDFCEFEYYGRKHLENSLTEFIQLYWFPGKFNVDKRTSHLSSMIVSGQMTRQEALCEIEKPIYEEKQMNGCIALIKDQLNIGDNEFEELMNSPTHQHTDYKTEDDTLLFSLLKFCGKIVKIGKRVIRK